MGDNTDVQEVHGGSIVDMRIEALFDCILHERWDEPDLDTLFNEIVAEFINGIVPPLKASEIGKEGYHRNHMVNYLMLLRLEFSVTYPTANHWPGLFEYLPDAECAVSLFYIHDPDDATSFSPGHNFNHAALLAVVQYARERAERINNQGELHLN